MKARAIDRAILTGGGMLDSLAIGASARSRRSAAPATTGAHPAGHIGGAIMIGWMVAMCALGQPIMFGNVAYRLHVKSISVRRIQGPLTNTRAPIPGASYEAQGAS